MQGWSERNRKRLKILVPALVGAVVLLGVVILPPRKPAAGSSEGNEDAGNAAMGPVQRVVIRNFERFVRSQDGSEPEALIQGERATAKQDKFFLIEKPVVTSLTGKVSGAEMGNVSVKNARLSAERAEFDEAKGVLHLLDRVKAEGEDFEAFTENVTYTTAERAVTGDAPVELKRFRLAPDGSRHLSVHVTGEGLAGDLTLRNVLIKRKPVATLMDVSSDFLQTAPTGIAAAEVRGPAEASNLVVICDGPMTYQHLAKKVQFENNVTCTYGDITVTSDRLEVLADNDQKAEKLQVTSITAEGNVVFTRLEQVARGERLVWQNLTQAGILTGEPASLSRPDLEVTTPRLTFFKVDMRFTGEGEGELTRRQAESAATPAQQEAASADMREPIAPIPLKPGGTIRVTWNKSMRYDATEKTAVFAGQVEAKQEGDTLNCEELRLRFGQDEQGGDALDLVTATGNVRGTQTLAGERRTVQCDQAVWRAKEGLVELQASEGGTVTVLSEGQRLVAPKALFKPDSSLLSCEGAGELALAAKTGEGPDQQAEPIRVEWERGMVFQGVGQRFAEFEGGVQAYRPGEKIMGDKVRVDFDEQMNPLKIISTGNAVLEVQRDQAGPAVEAGPGAGARPSEDRALTEGVFEVPQFDGAVTQWRISGEVLVGEPAAHVLSSPGPGLLEVMRQGEQGDRLRWSKSMRVDMGSGFALFEGEVKGRFSDATLACDKELRLDFDQARQLRYIDARGRVDFQAVGPSPWRLKAQRAEATFAAQSVLSQVIAHQDVLVSDRQSTVQAQLLHLYFSPSQEEGQIELDRANATTDVVVNYAGETPLQATCDELDWDKGSDEYVLRGNPARISKQGQSLQGGIVYVNPKDGTARVLKSDVPATTSVETPL